MDRREFVTAVGASVVVGGAVVPGEARATTHYTITPNGVDDTASFVNALQADSVVQLMQGTFLLSQMVYVPKNCTIIGAGPTLTTITWNVAVGRATGPLLGVDYGALGVYVAELRLSSLHPAANTRVGECGLWIRTGEVAVENCHFIRSDTGDILAEITDVVQIDVT